MPKIELSSLVYQRLLRRSVSFDDTAEAVIKRLLDQVEDSVDPDRSDSDVFLQNQPSALPSSLLPVGAYWLPILSFLAEAGGSAPANDVINALEEHMGGSLKDRDRERLRNGEVRWRNRARFARLRMKEHGLLSKTSQRGVWEITEDGRAYLRDHREK